MDYLRFKAYLSIYSCHEDSCNSNDELNLGDNISSCCNNICLQFASGFLVPLSNYENDNDNVSLGECLDGYISKKFSDHEKSILNTSSFTHDRMKSGKKSKKSGKSVVIKKPAVFAKLPLVPTRSETKQWGTVYPINGLSAMSEHPQASSIKKLNNVTDSLGIDIDVLCQVDLHNSVYEVARSIHSNVLMQVKEAFDRLKSIELSSGYAKAFHYCPPPLSIPTTIVHILDPATLNSPSSNLSLTDSHPSGMERRRALHVRLGLPTDRPLLLLQCAEKFQCDDEFESANNDETSDVSSRTTVNMHNKLKNVHVGLPSGGVVGGKQYLVQGDYQYFHYLQDQMDDKGWGCAYRSLQTLVSWYRLNHYSTLPVPSHADIQRSLVTIGDKPPSFIGSSGWIGSMEVGFYLDSQLNVTWRNISVPSGPDLASKARELAAHFLYHGTPIMMGGGNLAFTLLGVEWNENSGDVKFLILDPHYTGADDLSTIQQKVCPLEGYKATACGWRSADTFAKNSFYNLCAPQRPTNLI